MDLPNADILDLETPLANAGETTSPPHPLQLIPIEAIFVSPARQRRDPKLAKPLLELKRSILSKGLLHPPVLAHRAGSPAGEPELQLVAGERRLIAIRELHADGVEFMFNGVVVPPNHCPYTLVGQLSLADLEEAELEENLLRLALPWQEAADAKLRIHELRQSQNPSQTRRDTAIELAAKSPEATTSEGIELKTLKMAETVKPYLELPAIKGAKSLHKAYNIVLDQKRAALASTLRKITSRTTQNRLIHGDFFEIAPSLEKGTFDLILSDPPYGINAHTQSFEKKHDYDDTKDYALSLYREILWKGFHLLKPQGHIFLFCDIDHFLSIRTFAEQHAWSTWRTPIIWQKGSEGPAPWGANGFQRTFEIGLFAAKGQRPLLIGPEPDIKLVSRVNRGARSHAAEKPPEFLRWILQLTCQPGARVLDPCAGSAPLLVAAKDLGLELTLIEKSETYYNSACLRAQELETEETPELELAHPPVTQESLDDLIFGDDD